jgi:diamine N-acetyltransferase
MKTQRPLVVRAGRLVDAPLLTELGAATFIEAYRGDVPDDDLAAFVAGAFTPERQEQELADPNGRFLLAEQDGTVAVYAYLTVSGTPGARISHLGRIYARRDWIGRGVGSALMQACLDKAAGQGASLVRLTVWEDNARAIAFYRAWGFLVVGEERFLLGRQPQRDLVMVRPTCGPLPASPR